MNVEKSQDIDNIVLKSEEHKAAYAAFTTSFQAYMGSQLIPMELMVKDLNDMHLDDVKDMDIHWNMQPEENNAMCVTYDGEVDWSAYGAEIEKEFALMAQSADDDKIQEDEIDTSK
ncbi:hypothetical protein QVD17_41523 [Tagetes erecta]|uniref:Uncharacterized protein n=1 Tax=Tagetes erecta TaxID=13708 RepID=A0AAD8NFP7_TARER|nr:hypothetical protein QVD17_41523 [Tagetes erecta]